MTDTQTAETIANAAPLAVTERAARRIVEIAAKEPKRKLFRVSVEGGGCSGFQYKFEMADAANSDDLVIERAGATVLVDETSMIYLTGSSLDYVDDLMGAFFRVANPNAQSSCGCGTSFSI